MQVCEVNESIRQLRRAMEEHGYGGNRISQFGSTTNQLLDFMESSGISIYSMEVGMQFLTQVFGYNGDGSLSRSNRIRLQDLTMLSEFQLHGTFVLRHHSPAYHIPEQFQPAADKFLAHRRFVGIVEKNMGTISLYLERFFFYLSSQGVKTIMQIMGEHVHGYLRFISGFSNQSKDHMMRTVRQFLEYCYQNGYHPEDLTNYAPNVHYEKRARIPSAYSYEDVRKLLDTVDCSNPIGKRNYAILLLISRLGLRSGDVSTLRFENLDWEHSRISLTQHKTGRPLTLPLLEDVGLAIVDYLKFGRPDSESGVVFLRHRPPFNEFTPSALYNMVSGYIGKAGLLAAGKKCGPHALRHSLASRLLEENVPLPVISEILGHADTNTTAVYLSINIEQLRRCALEV